MEDRADQYQREPTDDRNPGGQRDALRSGQWRRFGRYEMLAIVLGRFRQGSGRFPATAGAQVGHDLRPLLSLAGSEAAGLAIAAMLVIRGLVRPRDPEVGQHTRCDPPGVGQVVSRYQHPDQRSGHRAIGASGVYPTDLGSQPDVS